MGWRKVHLALGLALGLAVVAVYLFLSMPSGSGTANLVPTSMEPVDAPVHNRPSVVSSAPTAVAQLPAQSLADILAEVGDLSRPGAREEAVRRMQELEKAQRANAQEEARRRGLPLRVERPDGVVQELAGFENGRPVYFTTHNSNAAISTGANVLREAPYQLLGSGLTVGVWDGGSVRATHQEFATGSRVTIQDGSTSVDHATHVGGTIGAAGVQAAARGMAPSVLLDSYDWTSDKSELTTRAAAAPAETGKLYLSNHSYGYISGWNYTGGSGSPARIWEWYGDGSTTAGAEQDFGRYNTYARDSDALAFSAPYFLMFRSAGNERTDNPSAGQTVALSAGGSTVVSYDSASHPTGDGGYRSGFETIAFDALAKNVVTVGSVSDAISGGVRNPTVAAVSSFSSWGPTDDGRIKPDIVANGEGVYSPLNGSNNSYGSLSGTSMATPNAVGTAALLMEEYSKLYPSAAMRASTLKGLLLHTADDIGRPGPDYQHGWGLLDGVEAVELLRDHAAHPLKARLTEGLITTTSATVTHDFVWDGVTPIRATLIWTDPAGAATTTNDLRSSRLVNNLQLSVTAPGGAVHQPYVMPFVGTWTPASMDQAAVPGINNTDSVEQVYLASPTAAGAYTCKITYSGTLTNNQQRYSLFITGSANEEPPPPNLTLASVSPATVLPGTVALMITGTGFVSSTAVKLTRSGQADLPAGLVTVQSGTSLTCQLSLAAAASGACNVVVSNPNSSTATLENALTVVGALWSESFDGTVLGWASAATTGSNAWVLITAASQSPDKSYFAPAPGSKTTTALTGPSFSIPGIATGLQFRFWHSYNLESGRDAGKLEFSLDGGAWFDITASGSGATFASNGYNTTVSSGGVPSGRNEFAGQQAWSGNSSGFLETIVNLTDTAKYAGHSLRARWRLATNNGTASAGWYVDTISLTGNASQANSAPVIASAATTDAPETATDPEGTLYHVARGQSLGVSVLGSDDGGEAALVYSWAANGPAEPSFSPNGGNAAKNSTVQFEAPGDYLITVNVTDAQGLAVSSSVNVRVLPTASGVEVSPSVTALVFGAVQQFTARVTDQFGLPYSPQPPAFEWSASGGGAVDGTGHYLASSAGGPFVVTATGGALSGISSVTVNPAPATVTLSGLIQPFDGNPKAVSVTTLPAGLPVSVLYDGSTAAPSGIGSYSVQATVTHPNYQGNATGILAIVEPSYDTWATDKGLAGNEVDEQADVDHDGLPNLLEYAAAGDPHVPNEAPWEVESQHGGLDFIYTKSKTAPGVTWTVEWSQSIETGWTSDGLSAGSVVSETAGSQRIKVHVPVTGRAFVRLKVTRVGP